MCLRDLFARQSKAGLVANLAKCEFAKATVTYLGHVVGHGHVVRRQAKVQVTEDFPAPLSNKQIGFPGMCRFYRKVCSVFQ